MFKKTSLALVMGFSALFTAPSMAQTTVKIGYAVAHNSHYGAGADAFCETLKAETAGRYVCQQFPNATLGNEREMAESVQIGALDVAYISSGTVGNFVPEMRVVDIPFLFRDYDHARKVMDGPVGQGLLEAFPEKGLIALAWGENGFRHLTNNAKPINQPSDLSGLKLRTMENKIHIDSFRALGALPTPMAWPEVYTALQQGTIDGQENPLAILLTAKMWQVQKYLSLTSHVYSPTLLLASPTLWESMSKEDQQALKKAGQAAAKAQRDRVDQDDAAAVALLEKEGMTVSRPDSKPFSDALEPVFADLAKTYGDTIKKIQNTQ